MNYRVVQNVGPDVYHGWDRGTNRAVDMQPNQIVTLSEEETVALLADFPARFVDHGGSLPMENPSPAEADNVVPLEQRITRKPARARRTKKAG